MAARARAGVALAALEGTWRVTWRTVPDCAGASVCPAGRIACGRAWPHGDRAASSAIALENEVKRNSVTIHAKFAQKFLDLHALPTLKHLRMRTTMSRSWRELCANTG